MDWREKYKDKMTTAAEAVSHVKSGVVPSPQQRQPAALTS